jgi:hypothetical protein
MAKEDDTIANSIHSPQPLNHLNVLSRHSMTRLKCIILVAVNAFKNKIRQLHLCIPTGDGTIGGDAERIKRSNDSSVLMMISTST